MSRRRRALLLGGLALILGGLAAADVAGREAAMQRELGGLVDVVMTQRPIAAGDRVRPAALAVREVPGRFAPGGAIASPVVAAGLRAAIDIPAGADLTIGMLGDGARGSGPPAPPVRPGERVAEVVAAGAPELVAAGSRVDVLVTREPRPGEGGETVLALEDVEVLSAAPAPAGAAAGGADVDVGAATGVAAALRVTLRQAVYLAAAQAFARELRLLPRAAGDRRRGSAGLAVGAALP